VKTTRRLAIATAAAALVMAACGQQKAPPAAMEMTMPEEVAARFVAAMDDFDPEAVRGLFTANAKVMPPNVATISGIDNILDYYKGTLAEELDFEMTRDAAGTSGGLAAAEGTYKVRNNATGEYIEQGKWMAVFVNVDGAWKVARFMTNTDAPVAVPSVEVEEPASE
jgi:limonene-1,2-epoxide hydrolase